MHKNKLTRQEAYALVDGERAYQDSKWPEQVPLPLSPGDELRLINTLIATANVTWSTTRDEVIHGVKVNQNDLVAMRKIAAVAVRCIETFGAPERAVPPPVSTKA